MKKAGVKPIRIKPFASHIIDYLSADREEQVSIAQANTPLDENDRIIPDQVTVRVRRRSPLPGDAGRAGRTTWTSRRSRSSRWRRR